jgi:hypothetical protein
MMSGTDSAPWNTVLKEASFSQQCKEAYHVIQNLVANDSHHLEALLAADAVDNHVTVDADKVLAVQNGVFVL